MMRYQPVYVIGGLLLLSLTACGAGESMQQGGQALQEASQRGWNGFLECQRQRDLKRFGLAYDMSKCPPVEASAPR